MNADAAGNTEVERNRPNLIVFLPETVRGDAVYGDLVHRAQTPNMDRLAQEGVSFTNCFCQAPYCGPSRCSMFTGLYPHTTGHRSLLHLLHNHERNFFQDLKEAGYVNVAYGKNDLLAQDAIESSFDEVDLRVKPERPTFMPNPWPDDHRFRYTFYRGCREETDYHDMDWACIESALQFLDEDHDSPFCIYLPLIFAHPPYEVEEPFFSMHDRSQMPEPIPLELSSRRTFMQRLHVAHGCDRLSEDDFREIKATYFGMVSRVDWQLGLLLDKLEERGLTEDTIVVVSSDHGDYAGDYGMIEKFLAGAEDCLLRVPLTMRVPGMTPAGEKAALCEMTDLYPTLMELLGLEPKHYHFGRSLTPLMYGATDVHRADIHRDAVFAEGGRHLDEYQFSPYIPDDSDYAGMRKLSASDPRVGRRTAIVRTETYKYAYCPEDRDELYDLKADPDGVHNVVDDPAYADARKEMRERLLRWMLDTGDVLPLEKDNRQWR